MLTAISDMSVPTKDQNWRRRMHSSDGVVDERP